MCHVRFEHIRGSPSANRSSPSKAIQPAHGEARAGAAPGGRPSTKTAARNSPTMASGWACRDGSRAHRRHGHGRRSQAERAAPGREMLGKARHLQQRAHRTTLIEEPGRAARGGRLASDGPAPPRPAAAGSAHVQAGSTKGAARGEAAAFGRPGHVGRRGPRIEGRRSRLSSSRGIEPGGPRVEMLGRANRSRTGARSTIRAHTSRPHPSAVSATTPSGG